MKKTENTHICVWVFTKTQGRIRTRKIGSNKIVFVIFSSKYVFIKKIMIFEKQLFFIKLQKTLWIQKYQTEKMCLPIEFRRIEIKRCICHWNVSKLILFSKLWVDHLQWIHAISLKIVIKTLIFYKMCDKTLGIQKYQTQKVCLSMGFVWIEVKQHIFNNFLFVKRNHLKIMCLTVHLCVSEKIIC